VVYDLGKRQIHFKTMKNANERIVDLAKFDFSCAKPARILDVNAAGSGDVTTHFANYSESNNLEIVKKSLETGFAHLPPEAVTKIASYPESLRCEK
jgi:ubiquinone/menaquinone biosynthesis C-methylase UbiE